METNTTATKNTQSGFALLLALVVVGVLVSIGLSVLDLSIKQVQLSTNARDSELAFHAANAGMECARYVRRTNAITMETGLGISPSCFTATANVVDNGTQITTGVTGQGEVYQYTYTFEWPVGAPDRCSEVTTVVASSSLALGNPGLTVTNMTNIIPGYPATQDLTCDRGARCTVIAVRGYNKLCGDINSYGTVQREVLLEF